MPKMRAAAAKKPKLALKINSRKKKDTAKLKIKKKSNGGLQLFSLFSKEKSKKNFSTNFEYGNLSFNIKSTVKGNLVTFNIKLNSKNINFTGVATLNALAFANLQDIFNHITANLSKMR